MFLSKTYSATVLLLLAKDAHPEYCFGDLIFKECDRPTHAASTVGSLKISLRLLFSAQTGSQAISQ